MFLKRMELGRKKSKIRRGRNNINCLIVVKQMPTEIYIKFQLDTGEVHKLLLKKWENAVSNVLHLQPFHNDLYSNQG